MKPVDRFIISLSVFTLSNLQNFESLSSKTSTNVASTDSLLPINRKGYLHNSNNYTCKLIGTYYQSLHEHKLEKQICEVAAGLLSW